MAPAHHHVSMSTDPTFRPDPALYQSERWNTGPFTYTFASLAGGSYQVTLKFAESELPLLATDVPASGALHVPLVTDFASPHDLEAGRMRTSYDAAPPAPFRSRKDRAGGARCAS